MSDDLLRDLGKDLPYERPDDARREAVRSSLLLAATRREEVPPQRWRMVAAFGAGMVATAAAAMLYFRQHTPTSAAAATLEHAHIESSAQAELEHSIAATSTGTDEVIRVHAGKVRISLAPVGAGDHVAITTGDAQVEGPGSYDISVHGDKLAALTVASGSARVAIGQQTIILAAGESWHADSWRADLELAPSTPVSNTPSPDSPAAPAVAARNEPTHEIARSGDAAIATPPARHTAVAASPKHAVDIDVVASVAPKAEAPTAPAVTASEVPKTEIAPASETEQHFRRGWSLLKQNKSIEAATELGRAAEGDGPLAVDARYFQAEALVKAGRKTEAEKALIAFLDHAKLSIRRGRATLILARLIAERGDLPTARNWYTAATGDADPAVVAAAQAGLASLRE